MHYLITLALANRLNAAFVHYFDLDMYARAGIGLLGIVNATLLDEFMDVVQKERAKFQVCTVTLGFK